MSAFCSFSRACTEQLAQSDPVQAIERGKRATSIYSPFSPWTTRAPTAPSLLTDGEEVNIRSGEELTGDSLLMTVYMILSHNELMKLSKVS
ncbi:hypothetical protein PROFUN_03728 [Planoprotostelium fungivorum]|uniref:Uncharacterized protein n=1 Tax=Planoprotostelium fungivorum TaxID=1890364 RepID=A0A2P6NDK6_9EUKA|nr:hypothetical protein PROFUN_03728 [Planoprotostelium fungivorum]